MKKLNDSGEGGILGIAIFLIIALAVGVGVTNTLTNPLTTVRNDTLNYTSTAQFTATVNGIAEWVDLSNTTTTLTRNTDYRVYTDNATVQLLNTGLTNLTGCGNWGQDCNYFARYYQLGTAGRTIVALFPLFFVIAVVLAVVGMYRREI